MNAFKELLGDIWAALIRMAAFVGKEMRAMLGQPRLVFSLILGPFLILLLFGLGYRSVPRTLNTLFVVPEDSQITSFVEAYAQGLGEPIAYQGITSSVDEADARLRRGDVDLVIVTPPDPLRDWQADQQSTFQFYHAQIDPLEETTIQVLGQRYAEEINQQTLLTAVAESQAKAASWQEDVSAARTLAGQVRQALDAGSTAEARAAAQTLQQDVDLLATSAGAGLALLGGLEAGTGGGDVNALLDELQRLQTHSGRVATATAGGGQLARAEQDAAEVEASLNQVDALLGRFQEMDTAVLVAPFRSETRTISETRLEPMHFYVPAVIALLLQHMAVTLAGLSIIREKLGGAMELFRAAPVSAGEMLIGKYGSYLLLLGALAAVLTALLIFGLAVPQLGTWTAYATVVVALLLASLGLGFNISLSARSDSQAIQYGMLTLLAAIFFSGFFLPLYRLALPVRIVSWLLPATYGTVMLQDVMLRGQPPGALPLLALSGFALLLFLLGWWRLWRQMRGSAA